MPKTQKIIMSFNAGELSPLMDARLDQVKYQAGCRTMENMIPLIYGGAEERPGLEYITDCISSSAKSRLISFEHSVDDTYILEFGNQIIRIYRNGAQIQSGTGTEDLSALSANIVAHWKLNDNAANTIVVDADGATHNGVATTNTENFNADGKVGTGSLDFNGQYAVEINDDDALSFGNGTVDSPFSIVAWVYVVKVSGNASILSKWDSGANKREWELLFKPDGLLQFGLADESAGSIGIFRTADSAVTKGWHLVGVTYPGQSTEGATAANLIKLYIDGAEISSFATNNGSYDAMENLTSKVVIGADEDSSSPNNFYPDKIDNVALFDKELSSSEMATLFTSAVHEIPTPYLTADLFSLKFEQSADVMFIAHPSYESRRLSRIGDIAWTLAVEGQEKGPFRPQNTDTSKTIVASGTTGSITLTAAGHFPFLSSATIGHVPNGSAATDKSQTGTLFQLIHASDNEVISHSFTGNASSAEILVTKGTTWDFVTTGTWIGTIKIEREFGNSGIWETVHPVINLSARNISTSGTEEVDDAQYRITMSGFGSGTAEVQFSVRDTSHIGIVKITAVASHTSATATVLTTLADTTATHRWSEGEFSNFRGWPIDVTISSEERLTFAGNISRPLTTWGSVIGDFTNFRLGTDDNDALNLTLVGSGQQNRIRWILSKNVLVIGTVGGEHLLGASRDEEALSPSNIKAKLQTTYGSEDIAALIVNQAVLFLQRGGRKIREFLYEFESDSFKADDLTVFAEHITESGIVNMTFQRTPDPMLWCVRDDGEMAIMTYERDQNIFSWARFITQTNLSGTTSDSDFESAAIIYGGAGNEDEVWVSVRRTISGVDARHVERFFQRKMPTAIADMKYLDSFITYTGGTTTATGLSHLIGQTVQVLGDGVVQTEASSGDFVVTGAGEITLPATFTTVQIGLGYTATVKPMKLDIQGLGQSVTMKINRGVFNFFETIGGKVGGSTSTLQDIPTGATLFTGSKEIALKDGYSRDGDILAQQSEALPMTVLSFVLDVGVNRD